MIKSMRMRWMGHTKLYLEVLEELAHSEDLGIDSRIILEWILGE
jgi:hypothetical protein